MKRLHFAFFSTPQYPCVNPTLSIVASLVHRGHRVSYVTSKRFASRVSSVGATVVTCPDFTNRFLPTSGKTWNHELPRQDEDFIDLANGTLESAAPFFERSLPDLIVYDVVCLAGRALAKRLGVPATQTSPALVFDRSHLSQQLRRPEFRQSVLDECRAYDQFLERYGIYGDSLNHRERLNVFFYPMEFQLPNTITDGTFYFAPRCVAEHPHQRTWCPPTSRQRRLVLVSTSTYYIQGSDYFRMCINALDGLDLHVVLAIGDYNDPRSFDPLPPHFEIVQNIPQIQVLPHADLLICLGGMITTVEAMSHGVPLLMMTHGHAEPELYADNNERVGIGVHLRNGEANAETLRRFVVRIFNDVALLERVKQMQRVIQLSPGAEETVDRMIRHLD